MSMGLDGMSSRNYSQIAFFIPYSLKRSRRMNFMKMQQRKMSVAEYALKMNYFKVRLNPNLKEKMSCASIPL